MGSDKKVEGNFYAEKIAVRSCINWIYFVFRSSERKESFINYLSHGLYLLVLPHDQT